MVFYQLLSTQFVLVGSIEHLNIHLGLALIVTSLNALINVKYRKLWPFLLAFIMAGLFVVTYIHINYKHLEMAIGLPTELDVVIGIILIIVILIGAGLAMGSIIPIIATISILYFFLGDRIPGLLGHAGFRPDYVVSLLGIGLSGSFGQFLSISANYVFLFLVFGGLLQATGGIEFIEEISKVVARKFVGGVGQTAVISSSLVGTISGSAVGNVALTGSFTIPLMKKAGYSSAEAGGIEAAASTGGQIMPPVMGAAAFIMAGLIGMPYVNIIFAAIIPAILYYLSVGFGVYILGAKRKITYSQEPINTKILKSTAAAFIMPLAILVVLLLRRLMLSFTRKELRFKWDRLIKGLVQGAIAGAGIALILACLGFMTETLYQTALGIKLTSLVESCSGGLMLPALFMTMVVAIILGCGAPTVGAYILVAVVVVPALVRMGVERLPAHFFALYFAILSNLTLPVAMAALTASKISGGSYWKTGIQSMRLAVGGLIVPFALIYNPSLLLGYGDMDILNILLSLVAMALLVVAVTISVFQFFKAPLILIEIILYVLSAVILGAFIVNGDYRFFVSGIVLFISLTAFHMARIKSSINRLSQADL